MAGDQSISPVEEPYVFTTIRYDPRLRESAENTAASCNCPCPIYLLEHHYTRLQVAKWSTSIYDGDRPRSSSGGPAYLLQGLLNSVKQWESRNPGEQPEGLRIKLRHYASGRITTEIWPVEAVPLAALFPPSLDRPAAAAAIGEPVWTIVLDVQPTRATEATMFKTNDRSSYGRARAAAGILTLSAPQEVLLFDPAGYVIDASISTPYFHRNGRWVTPSSACGGQQGTTRRWSLENGLCDEEQVSVTTIKDGEHMWISNAVRGYTRVRFVARAPPVGLPATNACDKIARSIC